MVNGEWMVAVTYLEWLRWIAVGRLRFNDRIVWVNPNDDQIGFNELMSRAPDLNIDDDHGYILASLGSDLHGCIEPLQSGSGLGVVQVPIGVVSRFYPLTERAARLLEADASRASVKLEPPEFESAWGVWLSNRREELRSNRARLLCQAIRLEECPHDALPEALVNILRGDAQSPAAEKASRLKGSSAYAWALAFGLFGEVVGDDVKKDFATRLKLNELLINMERNYPVSKPQTASPAVDVCVEMEGYLLGVGYEYFPLRLVAVVLHYQHLLATDRPVDLASFLSDLEKLGIDIGEREASLAASFVALEMENAAVSSLLYQSQPERFPSLQPVQAVYDLNVGARIKRNSKATKKMVQDEAAIPSEVGVAIETSHDVVLIPQDGSVATESDMVANPQAQPPATESVRIETIDGAKTVNRNAMPADAVFDQEKSLDSISSVDVPTKAAPAAKSSAGPAKEVHQDNQVGTVNAAYKDPVPPVRNAISSESVSAVAGGKDGASKSKGRRSSKKTAKDKSDDVAGRQKDLGI